VRDDVQEEEVDRGVLPLAADFPHHPIIALEDGILLTPLAD
jgi:hypothetical protein